MVLLTPNNILERARRNSPNSDSNGPRFGTFAWRMSNLNGVSAPVRDVPSQLPSIFGESYVIAAAGENQFKQLGV